MLSRLIWVRVKMQRESWVFISANGPGSERIEEEIEEFFSEFKRVCQGFW